MGIRVMNPGLLTSIQDGGRCGLSEYGISPSGALDQEAMKLANLLAGNPMEEAVFELTLYGGIYEFTTSCVIAITGADMQPHLGETPIRMYQAIPVNAGDILTLSYAKQGCRSYLAFAGGLSIPLVNNSKSTHLGCKLGGLEGRRLMAGDEIEFGQANLTSPDVTNRKISSEELKKLGLFTNLEKEKVIRVILGPQQEYFTKKGIKTFLHSPYKITNDSNRMGSKLDGEVIELKGKADIISDGIALGAIQISSNGKPIVMLQERQTTGGYAKIATVILSDLSDFVQCQPDTMVRFQAITLRKAQKLYRLKHQTLKALERRFACI